MTNMLHGNAVVGQSGGPTAAINATLAGVIRGVLAQCGPDAAIPCLYGMQNGVEGLLEERLIDLTARFSNNPDELDALELTPAAALGSCRKKLPAAGAPDEETVMGQLVSVLKKYDIRYFFYIGGNDSMDTVAKLSAYAAKVGYDMRVVGVPKTIDNDLMGTDHTPGFGSAAKYIAVTTQEIMRDTAVYTVPAVTIIEIMGRDTGWLTAASALGRVVNGRAPDLVYLPERDFDYDAFYRDVKAALDRHPDVVVAVSEGLRCADGRYVGEGTQSGVADVFGHRYLSGTGKALEMAVKEKFGCKVRSVELNLPQRCASHLSSAQDIEESVAVGRSAVETAIAGGSRIMMTIQRASTDPYTYAIGSAAIENIANMTQFVPDQFINPEGNHVTDACLYHLLPLIRGEKYPAYEGGLPIQCILK